MFDALRRLSMALQAEVRSDAFLRVLNGRRRQLPLRVGMVAMIGLFVPQLIGWPLALAWAAACGLTEVAEFGLTARLERAPGPARRRLQAAAAPLLAVNAAVFGAVSLPATYAGDLAMLGCAGFALAGCILLAVTTTQGSRLALAASLAPYVVYAAGLPFVAHALGASASGIVNLALSICAVVFLSLVVWLQSERSLLGEARALAEAERRRAEAEAATAAKSAFVATVSHELRTPISAILAGAEACRAGAQGAARRQAELILDAAGMMRVLLNDLLDLAKIEAGRLSVEQIPFDLRKLLAQTAWFWRSDAQARGLRLSIEGARQAPPWVLGDPTRLRQILNNLLSNAAKFTEDGTITLRIAPGVGDGDWVFSVIDEGPGISPDQAETLFQAFEQGASSRARTHGGTGLGLAISRDLARLMGGELGVQSELGHGATFSLHCPLPAAAAASAQPVQEPVQDLSRLRILVADDHEINRRALTLMLEAVGGEVLLADSGAGALEALAAQEFDLVLMDLNLGDMSGLEVIRGLRGGPGRNRATPVIAVTGAVEAQTIAACLAAGMTDVVAKPIQAHELLDAMARAVAGAAADAPVGTVRQA
jgi:signal transduction histidine kinase/CheY-like chemotaxis protein